MLSKLLMEQAICLVFVIVILFNSNIAFAQNPIADNGIFLWPNGAPGSQDVRKTETIVERSTNPAIKSRDIFGITEPSIIPVLPEKSKANGTAVIICPGGGYQLLAIDKEGFEIAQWLNSFGISAFVLKYRLPGEGHQSGYKVPLQDAQRAIRLIRQNAGQWGLDVKKIGIMGFSAGGHVASTLATQYSNTCYDNVDNADLLSARPDFMMLVYPVISMRNGVTHAGSRENLLGVNPSEQLVDQYSNDLHVDNNTPPTFMVQANDDRVSALNSARFYSALKVANVDAEYHVFRRGGHGFGLRNTKGPVALWPQLCEEWLMSLGMIPEKI